MALIVDSTEKAIDGRVIDIYMQTSMLEYVAVGSGGALGPALRGRLKSSSGCVTHFFAAALLQQVTTMNCLSSTS